MSPTLLTSLRGATLIEALVATCVLTTGVLAMAKLMTIATTANLSARSSTVAAILAEERVEQLRALGRIGLDVSPPSALQRNTPGFVDYVDAYGVSVGGGGEAPPQAIYSRRWSVEPLAGHAGSAFLIQVLVTPYRDRGRADQGDVLRLPGEARLVTVTRSLP